MTLPDRPGVGGGSAPNRPGAGSGINLPNRPGTGGGIALPDRPGVSRPDLNRPGVNRPDRPGVGGGTTSPERPGINRPDRPGSGIAAPNRPSWPSLGGPGGPPVPNRPGSAGRPSTGDLGDFLGMGRPITSSVTRRNTNINVRPTWVNIDNSRNTQIRNNINVQIGGVRNWQVDHRHRIDVRRGWGNSVRVHWSRRSSVWSSPNWWLRHPHFQPVWRHQVWFPVQPWTFWWSTPNFVTVRNWFVWAPQHTTVWQQPVFFDYGPGGNLYFEGDAVFMNGARIATADEFVQSAMDLATVPPPESEEQAMQAEWMSLGTFAVSTEEHDVDPTRVIQLAVDREGIVSGTMFNEATDEAYAVQGQVDRETQRVAIRVGESETFVLETGLYNLTQDEAPVFAHFGTERTESWLFVRLAEPEGEPTASMP